MTAIEKSRNVEINYCKYFIIILLLFTWSRFSFAQSKFSATAGWGYYELVNIGAQWNIAQISSLSVYAGANMGTKEKQL